MVHITKSTQTKLRIQEALLALLHDAPFQKISVQDIVDQADVNRSTFYRYFLDKYQIIEELEKEIFTGLIAYHHQSLEDSYGSPSNQTKKAQTFSMTKDENFFIYLYSWLETLMAILGPNGLPETQNRFRHILEDRFRSDMAQQTAELCPEIEELLIQHQVSSFMGILYYWMKYPSYSTLTIFDYYERLTREGILNFLQA